MAAVQANAVVVAKTKAESCFTRRKGNVNENWAQEYSEFFLNHGKCRKCVKS